jgi:hypothetical protein
MKNLVFATLFIGSSAHAGLDFFQCRSVEGMTPEMHVTINGERTVVLSDGTTVARTVRTSIGREALLAAWGVGEANSSNIQLELVRSTGRVGSIVASGSGDGNLTGTAQMDWLADGKPFTLNCVHFDW